MAPKDHDKLADEGTQPEDQPATPPPGEDLMQIETRDKPNTQKEITKLHNKKPGTSNPTPWDKEEEADTERTRPTIA